jgi:tetratricopeptide (TPR) repeat protein
MQDASEALAVTVPGERHEAEQYYTLGRAHKARNDLSAAEQAYRHSLRLRPDYLDAWVSLGIVLRATGQLAEAEACQCEALQLDPHSFLALLNLGAVLSSLARFTEAADCFRRAIAINPRSAKAHCNLGIALVQLREPEATLQLDAALRIDPDFFEAAEALGKALLEIGAFEHAIESLSRARRLRPDSLDIQLMLAAAYFGARRFEAARTEYERMLLENPGIPAALSGLATVYAEQGEYAKPRALYEQAIAQQPDYHQARANYAWLLLRHGDFARGWDFYESRWIGTPGAAGFERGFAAPRWQGEPLAGKTLLITREQGFGDELLFASVFSEVLREATHGIIECDVRLETLFRRSFPSATVFGVGGNEPRENRAVERKLDQLPRFDYWTPSGSLPRYRRRNAEDFPRHEGYLQAHAERTVHWKARLDALGHGLKIGVSWRGGTPRSRNGLRSLTLERLAPVLKAPGVHFVNLQYGQCRGEIDSFSGMRGVPIHHWAEAIEDYDETAALVSALDLVVSVCTAVVNLGGALNRPVWVMAPLVPDARYGCEGRTTIWYPSVRVFRQPQLDASASLNCMPGIQ